MRGLTVKIFSLVLVVLMVFSLCACSGSNTNLSPGEIASRLCKVDSNVSYVKLVPEQIPSFFNISVSSLEDYSVYIADDENSTNTIAVFKAADNKASVLEAINSYVAGLSKTFELSNSSEYKKLNARIIMELDDSIVLVVSDNIENMQEEIDEMGGKALK